MCAKLKPCPQAQGLASSPSFFPLSGLLGSAKHHAKAHFSRPICVGVLCPGLSPYSRKAAASAMPILSHNIASNAKYFTQPPDTPQPLALDWDEEDLPEQVAEAGRFDVILYISSSASGLDDPFAIFSSVLMFFPSQDGRRDIQHLFISLPPPHAFLPHQTKYPKFTPTSRSNPGLQGARPRRAIAVGYARK